MWSDINEKNVEIFVATHLDVTNPLYSDIYQLMQAGTAIAENRFNMPGDDTDDNISEKNLYYNELTILYWAWKNSKADVKGLCHYRRFFTTSYTSYKPTYILDRKTIHNVLKENDLIVPLPSYYRYKTVREGYLYNNVGLESDLEILEKVLSEKYPDYMEAYKQVMQSFKMSFCNMLISNSDIFDAYCEWLFAILFEVERNIELAGRESQQKRALGFMAERLLNVWIHKNYSLRIQYYPVVKLGQKKNCRYYIKRISEITGLYKSLKAWKDSYEQKTVK